MNNARRRDTLSFEPRQAPPLDWATLTRDEARQPADGEDIVRARRILIVEDNQDTGDTLAELLRLHGHQVAVAVTGLDGLEQADHFKPEVVILDLGLPDVHGHQVARRLRESLADCLLIASTAWGSPEDIERSLAAGCDAHFVKPVPLIRFLEAIGDS
jgi:DNA-binding response OmpR family regulator